MPHQLTEVMKTQVECITAKEWPIRAVALMNNKKTSILKKIENVGVNKIPEKQNNVKTSINFICYYSPKL